ncbi:glycosyltransferase [Sphingomonas sp. SUN019]|uniref:glycosyltransferase n=1 Tax=Sphingomonas sp. SUN019 TaxID=2937788 RepID=UPI00216498EC|nr:glycosyltransferase [Sphingomonas sp. SUN019]UVO48985.1 glycosyltransferase [Sphingomonas sp. SUN019]
MRWGKRPDRRKATVALPPLAPLPRAEGQPPAVRREFPTPPEKDDVARLAEDDVPDLSGREVWPAADHRSSEMWRQLSSAAAVLAEGTTRWRAAVIGSSYPIEAYDRFRRDIPIRPPPGPLPKLALSVLVDAAVAAPFLLRATLRSLQDQSMREWRAIVVGPASLSDHPVGAFAQTDTRIAFVADGAAIPAGAEHVVVLTAGTALDPEALAWLAFAAERTGAAAVFADHDDGVVDPAMGLVRADPWLPGLLDAATLAQGAAPAVMIAGGAAVRHALKIASFDGGDGVRRAILHSVLSGGEAVPHVARLLGTRLHLPVVARDGRDSDDDAAPGRLGPIPFVAPAPKPVSQRPDRIAIVIPTRDAADLLARAIDSLKRNARDPNRVEFIVVDNRSADEATWRLFDRLARDGAAQVMPFDAPFNWSQASNIGAAASDAPMIVFANNDIEMTSDGWDDRLIDQLSDPSVGAVGARLIYPGGAVQHAGVAFGFGPGGAEHEGRDRDATDPGPDRRFVTTHAVAAVTGAFLGVRRSDFDAIDGFDAGRLMIGHSDVDLCLRLRETGLVIRYCAQIEALHHEGATRGRNETRAAIAWDEGERRDLIDRWGAALGEDPSINPYWTRGGQPFDGLCEPAMTDVVRHIDSTARPDPWRPARRAAQENAAWRPEIFH